MKNKVIKYPRIFISAKGKFQDVTKCIIFPKSNYFYFVYKNGQKDSPVLANNHKDGFNERSCEKHVSDGSWEELTAEEAALWM